MLQPTIAKDGNDFRWGALSARYEKAPLGRSFLTVFSSFLACSKPPFSGKKAPSGAHFFPESSSSGCRFKGYSPDQIAVFGTKKRPRGNNDRHDICGGFFWSEFRLCEGSGYWLDGLLKA